MKLHKIKRGLDLPLFGVPNQQADDGPKVKTVAVLADDFAGMRPRMRIRQGDSVRRGQVLFEDRKTPGVLYTSPGAGTVSAIHRGERRSLQSIVIELDESELEDSAEPGEVAYPSYTGKTVNDLLPGDIRDLLVESGMWVAFRQRPFEKVPSPETTPQSIFVTAIDTNPLAPAPEQVVAGSEELFDAGLRAIAKLAAGARVHLCRAAGSEIGGTEINGVEIHEFEGPHPSGTPGLHMHLIDPVATEHVVWHVGYQDVIAIGNLVLHGKLLTRRVVSLAGPGVSRPRLLRTRLGACIDEIVEGELGDGGNRVVSGSVLNGRKATGVIWGYLGRYHNQISAIEEADERRLFGWLAPGLDRFSVLRLFVSKILPGRKLELSTDSHGQERVMLPLGVFEKVFPFDLLPTHLLRALMSDNDEMAEDLGCLELAEEDLSLCSFVCSSKIDYGTALRGALTRIEEESP